MASGRIQKVQIKPNDVSTQAEDKNNSTIHSGEIPINNTAKLVGKITKSDSSLAVSNTSISKPDLGQTGNIKGLSQQTGHVNEVHEFIEYQGSDSDTARTIVDNKNRKIIVETKTIVNAVVDEDEEMLIFTSVS
mgnify:CR=1 FL=1